MLAFSIHDLYPLFLMEDMYIMYLPSPGFNQAVVSMLQPCLKCRKQKKHYIIHDYGRSSCLNMHMTFDLSEETMPQQARKQLETELETTFCSFTAVAVRIQLSESRVYSDPTIVRLGLCHSIPIRSSILPPPRFPPGGVV